MRHPAGLFAADGVACSRLLAVYCPNETPIAVFALRKDEARGKEIIREIDAAPRESGTK